MLNDYLVQPLPALISSGGNPSSENKYLTVIFYGQDVRECMFAICSRTQKEYLYINIDLTLKVILQNR